jgi:hypothetical protein
MVLVVYLIPLLAYWFFSGYSKSLAVCSVALCAHYARWDTLPSQDSALLSRTL